MKNWYYRHGAEQRGPFDEAVMANLVASGKVRPDTQVWSLGMQNWTTAAAAGLCGGRAGTGNVGGAVPPPLYGGGVPQFDAQKARQTAAVAFAGFMSFLTGNSGTFAVVASIFVLRIIAVILVLCGIFEACWFGNMGKVFARFVIESDSSFVAWFASFLSGALAAFWVYLPSLIISMLRDIRNKA